MATTMRLHNERTIVRVYLKLTGDPIDYDVIRTYEKGSFFCLDLGERVLKYPIADIWRIEEEYRPELRRSI